MASETNSSPTCASVNASGGSKAWSNPTNAQAEDGSTASSNFGISETGSTEDLRALFSLSSVVGTVDGIVAEAKIARFGGPFHDGVIRLWHNGAMVGDNKSRGAGASWAATLNLTWVTWGSPTDTWNAGLTGHDVTDGTFGFSIQGIKPNTGATSTGHCDAMRITVYFTAPTGGDRGPLRGVLRGVLRCVRTVQGWLGVPPERRWRQSVAYGVPAMIGAA